MLETVEQYISKVDKSTKTPGLYERRKAISIEIGRYCYDIMNL